MTRLENMTRDTTWRDGDICLHDMPPSDDMSRVHDKMTRLKNWMTRLDDIPDLPPPALKESETALAEERDKKQRNNTVMETLSSSLSLSLSQTMTCLTSLTHTLSLSLSLSQTMTCLTAPRQALKERQKACVGEQGKQQQDKCCDGGTLLHTLSPLHTLSLSLSYTHCLSLSLTHTHTLSLK